MHDAFDTVALTIYRWMLRAYPRGFRELYQVDMMLDFADTYRDACAARTRWGRIAFWATTALDVFSSAFNERIRQTSYRSHHPLMIDITRFNNQLVSTVQLWEKCLRGGYNVWQMIDLAATNAPEPTASVMRDTLAQAETSGDLASAIATMPDRLDSPYLRQIVQVIMDQRTTGGNLADKLQAANATLRAELGGESWSDEVDLT